MVSERKLVEACWKENPAIMRCYAPSKLQQRFGRVDTSRNYPRGSPRSAPMSGSPTVAPLKQRVLEAQDNYSEDLRAEMACRFQVNTCVVGKRG